MSEKVILIIKVANQGSVDQKIECDLDWTILHLKEEISQCHPTKPTVGEQRLIYSGQLLQDSVTLRTILRHPSDNNEFIIHMVCSTTRTLPVNQLDNSNVATSSHSPGSGTSNNETESNTEGLRHRTVPSEQQIPALGVQQGLDTSVYSTLPQFPLAPQGVNDPIQQMAIMQQMYAQYMASYMQYIQYGGSERLFQDQNSGASPSSSISTNTNGDDQENNIVPPQNPNAEQEQRNAQGRLNQGRGPAEEVEEEMVARDWLDYLYFGSRMLILLSIVYFYSTLTRFIIVSGISILIYMYQRGGARARRDRGEVQPQDPGDQPRGQNANNNEGGPNGAQPVANVPLQPGPEGGANRDSGANSNAPQEAASTREENGRNDNLNNEERGRREENPGSNEVANDQPPILNPTREEVSPPQPSLLALSWTFLTTFFTSLIPEQHQIV